MQLAVSVSGSGHAETVDQFVPDESKQKFSYNFDMILQNAEGVKKQIYFDNPEVTENNAILDELETFADAIENNTTPIVTLEQGAEALRVAKLIINEF